MRQYFSAKQQHPDALIFFRMGDFYEMFYEDAVEASSVLAQKPVMVRKYRCVGFRIMLLMAI